MAYKCKICGISDVNQPGEVCPACSKRQNQSTAGSAVPGHGRNRKILIGDTSSLFRTDPYGNPIDNQDIQEETEVNASDAQSSSGSTVSVPVVDKNLPITSGITKNIVVDTQRISGLIKLFRTLFQGIPYTLDDEITMFQVFPNSSTSALNSMGNACDQVIVYGKIKAGAIAVNNDVEIYGRRDADNNVVAERIVNKASGTTVTPGRAVPVGVVWTLSVIIFAMLAFFVAAYGITGVVMAVIVLIILLNLPFILKTLAVILGLMFIFRHRD